MKGSNKGSLPTGFKQTSEKKTLRILFFDEKFFSTDGAYNVHDSRLRTINRVNVNEKDTDDQKHKFPRNVMVHQENCSTDVVF